MVTGLQYGYCYRWKLQICKLYKYTMEENTNHMVFLDLYGPCRYIHVNVNREYILTSKSPIRRESLRSLHRFHERTYFCLGFVA
jgi:hypothetical protein